MKLKAPTYDEILASIKEATRKIALSPWKDGPWKDGKKFDEKLNSDIEKSEIDHINHMREEQLRKRKRKRKYDSIVEELQRL